MKTLTLVKTFISVVESHVVVAALNYLKMHSVTDNPALTLLSSDLSLESDEKRSKVLHQVSREICLAYVDILAHFDQDNVKGDGVMSYAVQILSQGLLYLEFSDGIREGDGDRMLRCWQYFLIDFKVRRRKNYSIEALNILVQYHFFLPQRLAEQLK